MYGTLLGPLSHKQTNDVVMSMYRLIVVITIISFPSFTDALKMAAKRHEVTGIQVYDQWDKTLPSIGLIQAEDPETGQLEWLDTNDPLVQHHYSNRFTLAEEALSDLFRKSGAGLMLIKTDEDYLKILKKYFVRFKKHA
jgi:hypothetical protein